MTITAEKEIEIAKHNAKLAGEYLSWGLALSVIGQHDYFMGLGICGLLCIVLSFFAAQSSCYNIKKHQIEIEAPTTVKIISAVILLIWIIRLVSVFIDKIIF